MKRPIHFSTILLLLAWSFSFPVWAGDEPGGWKLKFIMNSDKAGNRLRHPTSLFIDESTKRYYVIDSGNNRLLSFDQAGEPLLSFDAGEQLIKPVAMAKNQADLLLVLEKGKEGLTNIDLKTKAITSAIIEYKGKKIRPQKIRYFNGLSYILDKATGIIFAVNDTGTINHHYSCNSCAIGFTDFHLQNGVVWALAQLEGEIVSFTEEGLLNKIIQLTPRPEFAVSFAISKAGDFFVVERHAGRISVYDPAGRFQYAILTRGEKEGSLYYPLEVQFDPWGRLCIVEEGNGRVSVFEQ